MPFFSQAIQGSQILINVAVLQPGDDIRKKYRSPKHAYKALVDTGATNTGISLKVAKNVGLLPQSKRTIITASQQVAVNVYNIDLHILIEKVVHVVPKGGKIAKPHSQFSVLSSRLQVTEFPQATNFDVILGMDVLSECSLFISGNNGAPFVTFCY